MKLQTFLCLMLVGAFVCHASPMWLFGGGANPPTSASTTSTAPNLPIDEVRVTIPDDPNPNPRPASHSPALNPETDHHNDEVRETIHDDPNPNPPPASHPFKSYFNPWAYKGFNDAWTGMTNKWYSPATPSETTSNLADENPLTTPSSTTASSRPASISLSSSSSNIGGTSPNLRLSQQGIVTNAKTPPISEQSSIIQHPSILQQQPSVHQHPIPTPILPPPPQPPSFPTPHDISRPPSLRASQEIATGPTSQFISIISIPRNQVSTEIDRYIHAGDAEYEAGRRCWFLAFRLIGFTASMRQAYDYFKSAELNYTIAVHVRNAHAIKLEPKKAAKLESRMKWTRRFIRWTRKLGRRSQNEGRQFGDDMRLLTNGSIPGRLARDFLNVSEVQ